MDAQAIIEAVEKVTGPWAKHRKAEERHASNEARRRDALTRCRRITVKDAAWRVMAAAYDKASSGGRYPAHARQIMYAARGEILFLTGKETLDDKYFCQLLLPDYLTAYPDETKDWDVVFDARGHFVEPHTGLIVPLGTLDVREYLTSIQQHGGTNPVSISDNLSFPTRGPLSRYAAVLFVEKEGFNPLFQAARLAERYDLAIMSTKGLSVTASRTLVDLLCSKYSIPLLVLHDFDKAGFSIVGTLRRNTRRYTFQNTIDVRDLGLRLADVQAQGLDSERCTYKSDPTDNLLENGAMEEEVDFLWGGDGGQRVELNAFTSGNLIAWIEDKLREQGIRKVIPDQDILAQAYRRAAEVVLLKRQLQHIQVAVRAEADGLVVPDDLAETVRRQQQNRPELPWDAIIGEEAVRQFVKTDGPDGQVSSRPIFRGSPHVSKGGDVRGHSRPTGK
jgi:hypothetical protein